MLENQNGQIDFRRSTGERDIELLYTEEKLRIRREQVNEAVELVGYDPVKIEQYLNRKNVA